MCVNTVEFANTINKMETTNGIFWRISCWIDIKGTSSTLLFYAKYFRRNFIYLFFLCSLSFYLLFMEKCTFRRCETIFTWLLHLFANIQSISLSQIFPSHFSKWNEWNFSVMRQINHKHFVENMSFHWISCQFYQT